MLRNKNQRELLSLSKNIIQPLLPHFHKGQAGKITVIGGSEDYTGAPYFSAHSAALVGADMTRVVCEVTAAPTIKSYSADLMVHPYLYNLNSSDLSISKDDVAKYSKLPVEELVAQKHPVLDDIIDSIILPKIAPVLDRSDLVIVGPGFGRDPLMLKTLVRIIEEIKVLNKPIIVDADGLYLLSVKPSLIQNYSKAILSPNPVEFDRLAKKQGVQSSLTERSVDRLAQQTAELSNSLGKVTIIRKGEKDIIAKGDEYLINEVNGSNKRVGGQGDTLTGAIATIVNWSNNYSDKLWDSDGSQRLDRDEANLLAVFAASSLVKLASHKAYRKHGRSMQASDVHEFLGESYSDLFEGDSFLKL